MDAAVIWLPWGSSLADAIEAADAAKRAAAEPILKMLGVPQRRVVRVASTDYAS